MTSMTAKEQVERLMNAIIPFAKQMLHEHGEFFPYGGLIQSDGSIVDVSAAEDGNDRPTSGALINILREDFKNRARSRSIIAAGIVADVKVMSPDTGTKTDAIQVNLEHKDGYSAEVCFPYAIDNGEIHYGQIFAQQGRNEIFEDR